MSLIRNMMRKTLLVLAAALMVASCDVRPRVPLHGARTCGSDFDCPDNMHCWFPGVDTYAQCLPGHGEERWAPAGGQ